MQRYTVFLNPPKEIRYFFKKCAIFLTLVPFQAVPPHKSLVKHDILSCKRPYFMMPLAIFYSIKDRILQIMPNDSAINPEEKNGFSESICIFASGLIILFHILQEERSVMLPCKVEIWRISDLLQGGIVLNVLPYLYQAAFRRILNSKWSMAVLRFIKIKPHFGDWEATITTNNGNKDYFQKCMRHNGRSRMYRL